MSVIHGRLPVSCQFYSEVCQLVARYALEVSSQLPDIHRRLPVSSRLYSLEVASQFPVRHWRLPVSSQLYSGGCQLVPSYTGEVASKFSVIQGRLPVRCQFYSEGCQLVDSYTVEVTSQFFFKMLNMMCVATRDITLSRVPRHGQGGIMTFLD